MLNGEKFKSLELIKKFSIEYLLNQIRDDLKKLNIKMDKYSSEKLVEDLSVEKTIQELDKGFDLYQGFTVSKKHCR